MKKINKAWLMFLSSNNYYIYMLLGLYKNLLDTNTKYPIYCGVTPNVNESTRTILKKVGLKLLDLDTSVIGTKTLENIKSKNSEHYYMAFTKLTLFDTKIEQLFNKVVYIDTDVQVFENIDDVFDYPHMAAIEDVAPSSNKIATPYHLGDSKFCSGMFVWDFKNNPGKGHEILIKLTELSSDIAWHDQNVLNYFYQNWREHTELHIPPEYGIMNFKGNMDKLKNPIKAIHYTSRLKTGWPFNYKTILKERQWLFTNVHFKEWITSIAAAVRYFNEACQLHIPALHPENIILLTKEQELSLQADGQTGCYLYF